MSVIEDALRRAELQGRSAPPQSIAQPGNLATAAAVVQRPALTPSTSASANHARTAPNSTQPETVTAKLKSTSARASRPAAAITPQKRYIGTMLIAAGTLLVLGHQSLETLLEHPPAPAIIVAQTDAPAPPSTRSAITAKSPTLNSLAEFDDATLSNEASSISAVNRPIPIDTGNDSSPARASDRAAMPERPPVNQIEQSATDAELIESINQRFHVAGVMVSTGRRLAVINDVVVGVGDRVDGAIVRAVDARGAVIEVDGMKHHLNVSARRRNDNTK